MSKLLCIVAFCRSSTWLEPSVESLLQSPISEFSLNSELLSISESFLKSPIAELSVDSELFSISIPYDLGKYLVHQAEPLYLARLNTIGRLPGIPEGAVKDRLTHCH